MRTLLVGIENCWVEGGELASLWTRMLETYHPLGGGPLCGAQQRYLIRSPVVGWLGALAFTVKDTCAGDAATPGP